MFLRSHSKFGLICAKDNSLNFLYSRFIVDRKIGTRLDKVEMFETYSPLLSDVYVPEGVVISDQYRLLAAYYIPLGINVEFIWKKDDFDLPPTFLQTQYELLFPDRIEIFHSGIYKLMVIEKESGKKLTFTYNVFVIGVPKLKNYSNLPSRIFRFSNESVSLSIELEGFNMTTDLLINESQMDLSNKKAKKESIKNLKTQYPYLSNLSFDIRQSGGLYQSVMQYQVNNLQMLSADSHQMHVIRLTAKNPAGLLKIKTFIEILEKPIWKVSLSNYAIAKKQVYRCQILEDTFTNRGINVKYDWFLNNSSFSDIEEVKNRFSIEGNSLILDSLENSNLNVIKILENSSLSCRVSLFAPKSIVNRKTVYEKIYPINQDDVVLSQAQTKIQVEPYQTDHVRASLYLLYLLLLIIPLTIVILICIFRKRVFSGVSEYISNCRNKNERQINSDYPETTLSSTEEQQIQCTEV